MAMDCSLQVKYFCFRFGQRCIVLTYQFMNSGFHVHAVIPEYFTSHANIDLGSNIWGSRSFSAMWYQKQDKSETNLEDSVDQYFLP